MSEAIQAREASLKDKQIELGKQIKVSILPILNHHLRHLNEEI